MPSSSNSSKNGSFNADKFKEGRKNDEASAALREEIERKAALINGLQVRRATPAPVRPLRWPTAPRGPPLLLLRGPTQKEERPAWARALHNVLTARCATHSEHRQLMHQRS